MARPYHSAVNGRGCDVDCEPIDEYAADGNLAFAHDVMVGWDRRFGGAGVIYCEPAWRHGFVKFMAKAGVEVPSKLYRQYLGNVRAIVRRAGCPAYVLMGKSMIRQMSPDAVVDVYMPVHGGWAFYGLYGGASRNVHKKTTLQAERFICEKAQGPVLDFCCGYGHIAEQCMEHGKNWILSDVNPKCIGYIARRFMGYGG